MHSDATPDGAQRYFDIAAQGCQTFRMDPG
ncbi:hypothetical protein PCAR4_570130 [Paraburkholderia caribensis]|nr:hypothetical protein PCAR4_570130 [Paraburkholderia caribensis]